MGTVCSEMNGAGGTSRHSAGVRYTNFLAQMNILGINAYHGNASAAIVCDGQLVAAVEEEALQSCEIRRGFPFCGDTLLLKEAGLTLADVDHVAVPRNPFARLGTKLFYAARMPSFARERIKVLAKFTGIREALAGSLDADPQRMKSIFHRVEHHIAHLASSFYCSLLRMLRCFPRMGSAILRAPCGARALAAASTSMARIAFPHSLGLFYTAVTQYLGFLKFATSTK